MGSPIIYELWDHFFEKFLQRGELFSKMTFPIASGIFVSQRYMLIVYGKIAKPTVRPLEVIVKYENRFALRILLKSGDHLPGERELQRQNP